MTTGHAAPSGAQQMKRERGGGELFSVADRESNTKGEHRNKCIPLIERILDRKTNERDENVTGNGGEENKQNRNEEENEKSIMKSLKTHSICPKYSFPFAFLSLSFRLTISFLFAEGKHSHTNVNNSLSIAVQGSFAFALRLVKTVPLSLEHELFPSERLPFLSTLALFRRFPVAFAS